MGMRSQDPSTVIEDVRATLLPAARSRADMP